MICRSFHVRCIPCGCLPGAPLHILWPGAPPSGSGTSVGSTAETSEKCHTLIVTCLSRQAKALSINSQCQHGKVTACSKLLPYLAQHTLRRDACSIAFGLSNNMTLDAGQVFCYVTCTAFTMSDLQRKWEQSGQYKQAYLEHPCRTL